LAFVVAFVKATVTLTFLVDEVFEAVMETICGAEGFEETETASTEETITTDNQLINVINTKIFNCFATFASRLSLVQKTYTY
jgi:hypothetical protein